MHKYLLYLLVISNSLKILYSPTNPYIRVTPLDNIRLEKPKEIITFEFQDIKLGKVSTSPAYTLWSSSSVYGNYISKLNENLLKMIE
jgi:hypothetical protein